MPLSRAVSLAQRVLNTEELGRLVRFGCVGVGVTALYFATTAALVAMAGLAPVAASLIAHLAATVASYLGHRIISFRSRQPHSVTLPRFLVTLVVGLAVNALGMYVVVGVWGAPLWVGMSVVTVAIVAGNYLAGRLWVFMSHE